LKKLRGENMKETSAYGSRLKALREEQARLERKQAELIDKRRAEIGKLVERLGLLEADDDALAGALLELKEASSKTGDERLARWRATGASFRRKNADRKAAPSRADHGLAQPDSDAARR
jgi:Conjugal transfer protein TraD